MYNIVYILTRCNKSNDITYIQKENRLKLFAVLPVTACYIFKRIYSRTTTKMKI